MLGKELNVKIERTQEGIAKEVLEKLYKHLEDQKKELIQAEEKLKEALEKDIKDIKESDAHSWNWD